MGQVVKDVSAAQPLPLHRKSWLGRRLPGVWTPALGTICAEPLGPGAPPQQACAPEWRFSPIISDSGVSILSCPEVPYEGSRKQWGGGKNRGKEGNEVGAWVTGSQRGGAGPGQGGAPRTQDRSGRDVQGLKQADLRPQETAGGEPPGRGGRKMDQAPASFPEDCLHHQQPRQAEEGDKGGREVRPKCRRLSGFCCGLGKPARDASTPRATWLRGGGARDPGVCRMGSSWPSPCGRWMAASSPPPHAVSPLSRASVDSSPRRRKTGSGPPRWPHLAFTSCLKRLIAKYNHTASY